MKIGVDLSALQSPHRMRGIGFTVLNFVNHISAADKKKHEFVFFIYQEEPSPLELLDLTGMSYEVRYLSPKRIVSSGKTFLPARVQRLMVSSIRQIRELTSRYAGSVSIRDLSGIEAFIQPDQSESLPTGRRIKKVLIIYDIIPYVLEWEYLWSYKTARLRGYPRKAALRCKARRWLYIKKLRVNARRADVLLAISQTTKSDFVTRVGVNAQKIEVIHLGVTMNQSGETAELQRYLPTSWGYLPKPYSLDGSEPYLLYVGGADRRRRVDELVTAFNNLRAQGIPLKLVLSGDTMQGPKNIATEEIQGALQSSSYLDDIIFTGFTSDSTRNWLYKNTLAFVYPSKYEGFGLPILEAMLHGCPVICYPNRAVKEVAGDRPIYVHNAEDIKSEVLELLDMNHQKRQDIGRKNMDYAKKYSWDKTSSSILSAIV